MLYYLRKGEVIGLKKIQENVDRVDKDAYEREQERIAREREAIAEMAGMSAEETKEAGRKKSADRDKE